MHTEKLYGHFCFFYLSGFVKAITEHLIVRCLFDLIAHLVLSNPSVYVTINKSKDRTVHTIAATWTNVGVVQTKQAISRLNGRLHNSQIFIEWGS